MRGSSNKSTLCATYYFTTSIASLERGDPRLPKIPPLDPPLPFVVNSPYDDHPNPVLPLFVAAILYKSDCEIYLNVTLDLDYDDVDGSTELSKL